MHLVPGMVLDGSEAESHRRAGNKLLGLVVIVFFISASVDVCQYTPPSKFVKRKYFLDRNSVYW